MKDNLTLVYYEYQADPENPKQYNCKVQICEGAKDLAYFMLESAKEKYRNIQVFTVTNPVYQA